MNTEIKYITHNNIDIVSYDNCIAESLNARVYAYSWYLNCVTDDWDALVLNDYEAVMPLPVRKKYRLHYIYQAAWIQQLGVFSRDTIGKELIKAFVNAIPKKFVLVDYFFNAENILSDTFFKKRTNYIVPLYKSFEEIRKAYNNNRKRASKYDFTDYVLDKKGNSKEFLDLYLNQEQNYKGHHDSMEKLQNILEAKNSSVNIWNVFKNGELIAGLLWLWDMKRITYLLPVANKDAKKNNIPTFIINMLIQEFQNSNYILDFEGSMIEGVARFYKSFGAKEEEYYWYRKKQLF